MRYYCIKQHDITDCGVACLATICKQNGYKIGITQIREVAGTDKQGTNAYGVIKAAEHLGFSAKGVKGNKESFFSEFPLLCIAVECPSKNGVSFNSTDSFIRGITTRKSEKRTEFTANCIHWTEHRKCRRTTQRFLWCVSDRMECT